MIWNDKATENTPLFRSKIDMIKLIRSFSNLGLVEAKLITEAWLNCYGISNYEAIDSNWARGFIQFAGAFAKGRFVVDPSGALRPATPSTLSNQDIRDISENRL